MLGVCNFTTGSCIHFNIAKVEEPGNTTEWIVETPDSYGDPYPLANYGMAGLRNSCWAPTTTLVVTQGGVVTPVGSGGGSGTVNCQPITTGNSMVAIELEQVYSNGWRSQSLPGPISTNGMDFDATYYHFQ